MVIIRVLSIYRWVRLSILVFSLAEVTASTILYYEIEPARKKLAIQYQLEFLYSYDQFVVYSETRFCHQVIVGSKEQWQQLVMFERLCDPHG